MVNHLLRRKRLSPGLLLTCFASLSLAQTPNLESAQLLPGSPVVGPAYGTQRAPALTMGDTSSLLVFEDNRAGDLDLFGLRLDSGGAPIDALPFPISKAPGDQSAPKVVWNGQNWLVVYKNQVDPGSGYFAYQTAALRVSPAGQVLDAAPIVIDLDSTGAGFAAASDGQGWVVATAGYSGGNAGLKAKRVSSAGTVLDPLGVVVQPETFFILFNPQVSFAGGQYLFTWSDNGMKGKRFTPALTPIDAQQVSVSAQDGHLSSNGAQYLVTVVRQTPQFTQEVALTALSSPTLATLGTSVVSNPLISSGPTSATSVWTGTQWVASWLDFGSQVARAARMTSTGTVLDPGGIVLPEGNASVLYDKSMGALPGGGVLVNWDDFRYGNALDVWGTSLGADGLPGGERIYSLGSEALQRPRVAQGDKQALVVYRAELSNGSRVLVQRVDPLGNALDPEPIEVASSTSNNLFAGSAAWNGTHYLVAWSNSSEGKVYARRLSADGQWVDPAPVFVLLGGAADVAALGQDFLVSGLRAPSNPQYVFAYAARVRGADAAVLDSPPLLVGNSFATRTRITTLGGRWLVATESHASHDENFAGLLYAFVDANGLVSAQMNAGSLNIQNWGSIDIASSGTSAYYIGQSGSNWTNTDLFAQRILPDGSLAGVLTNITGAVGFGQSCASVGWTGAEYLVAYESYENNVWSYDFEPDVYAKRVSETGVVQEPLGFALWNGEDFETGVDVGSIGEGKALAAAAVYVDGSYASTRIGLRALRPAGLENFGYGTPGCTGALKLDANGEPSIGNAAFATHCSHAPASALGVQALSTVADVLGSDPLGLGVLTHVGVFSPAVLLLPPMLADAAGNASAALPIPADPSLVGASVFLQAAFFWNAAACTPSVSGWSSSDGLELVVQGL